MNEELTIENIEQWNEEHPDDCHSPWMGILDDEEATLEYDLEEESPLETVEKVEVQEVPVPKSPYTGDITGFIVAAMVISVIVIVATLRGVFGKGMDGEQGESNNEPHLECDYADKIQAGQISGAMLSMTELNANNIQVGMGGSSMTREELEQEIKQNDEVIVSNEWAEEAQICMDKLAEIEKIIDDPLVKSFGSIGTTKIREVLEQ